MSKKTDIQKQIRQKDTAEIDKLVRDKREELRLFRFGATGSKAKNVKAGRTLRKEIARALTELAIRRVAIPVNK